MPVDIRKLEESAFELDNTISTVEAAAIVGTSINTIIDWCRKYHIGKKVGGRFRVNPDRLSLLLKGIKKY